MTAATRRAALGAILAAPLASVPVIASSALPVHEVRFMALAPRLVPMLEEFDRLWALCLPLYDRFDRVRPAFDIKDPLAFERIPEWIEYKDARKPSDDLSDRIEELYSPFAGLQMTTFPAIKLRHRVGMSFEIYRDDVLADLDALSKLAA